MDAADRRRIAETLQREFDRIAEAGATRFLSQLSSGSLRLQGPGTRDRVAGRHRSPHQQAGIRAPQYPISDLLKEGLTQVVGTFSLGVLVDEPGVLADDLDWLRRMLGARGIHLDPTMLDLLLRSYLDACSSLLEPQDIEALDDLVARAKGRLT